MKTLKFYLLIITAIFFVTFKSGAQSSHKIEKRIGNIVYELDTINYIIKNKANKLAHEKFYCGNCHVYFDNFSKEAETAWKDHFKHIFDLDRAKELNFRIIVRSVCDSTGLIKEIFIYFRNRENFEKIKLNEIKMIEDAAKKYRYKFISFTGCEGQHYFGIIHHPINPYLLYFDKPKK